MNSTKTAISSTPTRTPANESLSIKQQQPETKKSLYQTPVQRKLSIGAADDPLEKEADDMADKVMRMEMPSAINFSFSKNAVNRKCSQCEEEEEKVQRKESSDDPVSTAPSIVHNVVNSSGGRSLDTDTRSFMEPRFNYDFSNVKIHDSDLAAKSASSINALAYTSGNNVVFNSGQYNTNSDSGKRLLAHELTHVVQQGIEPKTKKIQRWSWGSFGIGAAIGAGIGALAGGILGGLLGGPVGAVLGALGGGLIGSLIGGLIGGLSGSSDKIDSGKTKFAAGTFDAITGIYIVEAGDKLINVASRLGVSVNAILKDNPGVSATGELMPGENLFISDIILPSIPKGREHDEWSFDSYVTRWESLKGRPITAGETKQLARGCIGVTAINIGKNPLSNLDLCYTSFPQAIKKSKELFKAFSAAGISDTKKLQIFSKRFYAAPGKNYPADKSGKVDMSEYSGEAKPGYVNFDYGFFDAETGMWWHANHCDPVKTDSVKCKSVYDSSERMFVYESSLAYYSQDLADFNKQIFCVVIQDV